MFGSLTNRISFRLARTAVLIALVVGTVLSLGQLYLDYRDADTGLERQIREGQLLAEKAAIRAVFHLDADLAQEVALGFLELDYVVKVVISDDDGNILTSTEREAPANLEDAELGFVQKFFDRVDVYNYPLKLPHRILAEKPGMLQVHASRAVGLEPFFDRAIAIFLSGLLRNMVLALLLYFVFFRRLTQPLQAIVDKISAIDPEHPGEQRVELDKRHEGDEFGLLASRINNAFDAVQALIDNLRASNKALISSEEMLRMRSWELEQEVERAQQTSMELNATKERAEAANRAKSVFLANVSHELRTPLNAIIGFSSIMADEMFGPVGHDKYHQYLQDIRDSSRHLSDVLGEVLDLAKIEAGEMKVEEEAVDIRRLCEESIALASAQALQKGISIEYNITGDLPKIYGDRLRIKQSVLNLLSNAVKFTPNGGAAVCLNAGLDDEGGMFVRVTDQGIGIAADEQHLIFAPFIRSSSPHSRSHEGTGLGLALVQAFMDVHQGQVTLESALGRGASFTLSFPAERVLAPDASSQAAQ